AAPRDAFCHRRGRWRTPIGPAMPELITGMTLLMVRSSSVMVVVDLSQRPGCKILLRHCRSRLRSILKTKSRQQMKRNRANLIPATSPGPDPDPGASTRTARVIALLIPLLSISCSSFEREWKKSTTPPGLAGARATAQPPPAPRRPQSSLW
ncbi:MAG: hypothetical protein RIS02_1698, partial [Pseudomonadota bacterium]